MNRDEPVQRPHPISFDESEARNIIALVPDEVGFAFRRAMVEAPELFLMDEFELLKSLKKGGRGPNPIDNRIRLKFWVEFDRVMMEDANHINMTSVFASICTKGFFYDNYLKNTTRVAWLLCPPSDYQNKTLEALDFALDQMRDILAQPHVDENGNCFDVKLAAVKIKITEMLLNRVRGSVIQKVESKNLNVNLPTSRRITELMADETEDTLKKRLGQLHAKERQALHLPPADHETNPIDITPERATDEISV